jgi:LPXTG-site transpeptidase (sortase) family protein
LKAISLLVTIVLGVSLMAVGVAVFEGALRSETTPQVLNEAEAPSEEEEAVSEEEAQEEVAEVMAEPVSTAPIIRIKAPRIGMDANVIELGIDPDGTMQAPSNPRDVAWYTFSSRPGFTGNVVLSGHVDYANYGPAVFWRLRDLREGDEVRVMLEDGLEFAYRVVSSISYDADKAPVAEIVGPTESEVITLITCTGTFNRGSRDYDKRLVVRGERLPAG